jgi:hypothetical protein
VTCQILQPPRNQLTMIDSCDYDDNPEPSDDPDDPSYVKPKLKKFMVLAWTTDCGGGTDDLKFTADTVKECYSFIAGPSQRMVIHRSTGPLIFYTFNEYEIVDTSNYARIAYFDCPSFNGVPTVELDDDPLFGRELWALKDKGLLD